MGGDEAVIAIGVGCRRGCPADEIVGLVRRAMADVSEAPGGLFSIAEKAGEPGLAEAAARLGLTLVLLSADALRNFEGAATTRSPRIEAMHGLPSVAETAALAGAGDGAMLLVARMSTSRATCAVAASPSPACGRRWPDEVGSDEGSRRAGDIA